jgi:CarD family transcriptional regulator
VDLEPGDVVVHPQHGTATVVDVEDREVGGVSRRYVVLRSVEDDLTLRVPLDQLDQLGVRDTAGRSEAQRILRVLSEPPAALSASWQNRRAFNRSRIRSGDPGDIAAVVRDLHAWIEERDAPAADRRMLEEARERMVNELADSLGVPAEDVEAMIASRLSADADPA